MQHDITWHINMLGIVGLFVPPQVMLLVNSHCHMTDQQTDRHETDALRFHYAHGQSNNNTLEI